jgi:DNA-binding NtrC family response regulator
VIAHASNAAALKTILVVEDDPDLRALVSEELRGAGFQAIEAATTDEALAWLRQGGRPALVFTDIVVPGRVDGIGAALKIQREYPDVPVLLASGIVTAREGVPPQLKVVRKPYDLAKVVSEITRMVDESAKKG